MYTDLANRVREKDAKQAEEFQRLATPTFTGIYMYRALIDGDKLRAVSPDNVSLKGAFIVSIVKYDQNLR